MEIITSQQNSKIKNLLKLRKAGKRRQNNLIIIEGRKEVEMAVSAGVKLTELYICAEYTNSGQAHYPNAAEEYRVNSDVMKKISIRENPDGYIAVARPNRLKLNDLKLSSSPLLVVLENVEKPGNLGAILRTADAVGVDAVLAADPQTDIYNPNVIRASLGTVFTSQVVGETLDNIIKWLKDRKIKTIAATPEARHFYTNISYKDATAIMVGTEHEGLSQKALELANIKVKIPMHGKIDSLNASVSTAVILYEIYRQRNVQN